MDDLRRIPRAESRLPSAILMLEDEDEDCLRCNIPEYPAVRLLLVLCAHFFCATGNAGVCAQQGQASLGDQPQEQHARFRQQK